MISRTLRHICWHGMLIAFLALALTACAIVGETSPTQVAQVPPEAVVTFDFPPSGSIIYASQIAFRGTAQNLPAEGFRLSILDTDDELVAEANIIPDATGNWALELAHGHEGEPSEYAAIALPANPETFGDYAMTSFIIAEESYRPDGTYGILLQPSPEEVVGGDVIPVTGTASGLFENTLVLTLAHNERVIAQEILTLNNPYFIDEIIWTVDMPTNNYAGPATLTISYTNAESGAEIILDSVTFFLSEIAG